MLGAVAAEVRERREVHQVGYLGEEQAAKSIDESLRKLQTEYIDLLLIHQAYSDVFGTWRA